MLGARLHRVSLVLAILVGCAPEPAAPVVGTSTGSGTTHASSSGGASSSTGAAGTTSQADSTTGAECVKVVDAGPFTLVTEEWLGGMSTADVDGDGELDVVGGRGIVVYSDLSLLALDPPLVGAQFGEFTGDDIPDLVDSGYATGDAFVVAPSFAERGGTPIATPGESPLTFMVGDYDRDGVDDIAAGYPDGVRVWRAEGDGTFTSPGLFGPGYASDLTFFTQDDEVRLMTTHGLGDAGGIYGQQAGSFVLIEDFPQRGVVSVDEVELYVGEIGHVFMTVWEDVPLSAVESSVSVISDQGDGWSGLEYDLHGGFPFDAAMIDIDADGIAEAAVIEVDDAGEPVISIVCVGSDRLVLCGRTSVPEIPERVELMPEGPRLLFTSMHDGTWAADLTVTECPS